MPAADRGEAAAVRQAGRSIQGLLHQHAHRRLELAIMTREEIAGLALDLHVPIDAVVRKEPDASGFKAPLKDSNVTAVGLFLHRLFLPVPRQRSAAVRKGGERTFQFRPSFAQLIAMNLEQRAIRDGQGLRRASFIKRSDVERIHSERSDVTSAFRPDLDALQGGRLRRPLCPSRSPR